MLCSGCGGWRVGADGGPSQQLLRQTALGVSPSLARRQQRRLLSDETRQAIDRAVASAPVVLFMKGTPELPQCGFSRASIQILGMQGVDPAKFAAFNVLEDAELRAGALSQTLPPPVERHGWC